MATLLANAHIEAQARLRQIVATAALLTWQRLASYDETDIEPFLLTVLPIITAGQRQSVALTEAYLAQALRRAPIGIPTDNLVGAAVRGGTDPADVYRRPFVTLWTKLKDGLLWDAAQHAAEARLTGTASVDMQLSSRATFQAVQQESDGIYGYRRVADGGACAFCQAVNGAYVKNADAAPLHNHCGCSLEPLTSPHARAVYLPSGESVHDHYAIHEHGELGSYIGAPDQHFTDEEAI